MKRWDRLVEQYLEGYEAAGKTVESLKATRRELERWGSWMKNLRPRPTLEEVNAEVIIRYLRGRAAYRAKATMSEKSTSGSRPGTWSGLSAEIAFLPRILP